ncbi:hypothetical protein EJK55_1681 [Moraxella catarrhalis]|uniref:Uncharacterized protein n=2 Tax=Moraxella catarrhalis TaxID=480 RepID=A0ABY0BKG2_MORCA|nr:hypothetical protein MCR_1812 [Moraxella catarrhalis BBH18]EGE09911.1 hypothetical protein E9G_09165 [Moraxella catarrhalis 7169]EGE15328.1 hypothetical protein E9K_03451 [Moraxella catarrhalis 103P14B1]EGE16249.1 hypothetical protein E9Q_08860 [Moraxella catarrhalis BC1]EGE17899.1 hypothetical protein E9O_00145 [Moraxella catarrhalis 12P80B1]EGE18285.1 hypothetical protein E9U_09205 [Moraxella catarrhalis BC8]EGE22156.1 hypothetical protein E9S_00949 [Moraxella catarrhalis BC7]EGE22829.1
MEQMTLKKASYSNLTVNFRQVLVQKYTIVQEVCTNLSTIILAHTVKQCFRQISCW